MVHGSETPGAAQGRRRPSPRGGPVQPIRVVLVDDHPVLRHGLDLLLRGRGIDIVGQAGSAAAAWATLERQRADVVVLDLGLPDAPGDELCRRLLERDPERGLLIYTSAGDDGDLRRALDCGAQGYLLKSASTEELVEAIRAVARGEGYLDPRLGPLLLARHSEARTGVLSDREREVLGLLAHGLTGEAIAERLDLAPETVRTHLRNAMKKLPASTRAHAVAVAARRGEITL